MPNLAIRNVPEAIVEALARRAARNGRSLQRELAAILAAAAEERPALSADQFYERMSRLGRSAQSDSGEILRAMRDQRYGD